ncbi:unnamed protein product, partial [marine sediment metagenome]
WKGGITPLNKQIRCLDEYKLWILEVFKRDNWTCQECNKRSKTGEPLILHSHHTILFINILHNNRISKIEDAISCNELWDIDNGITLCEKCHRNIHFREETV